MGLEGNYTTQLAIERELSSTVYTDFRGALRLFHKTRKYPQDLLIEHMLKEGAVAESQALAALLARDQVSPDEFSRGRIRFDKKDTGVCFKGPDTTPFKRGNDNIKPSTRQEHPSTLTDRMVQELPQARSLDVPGYLQKLEPLVVGVTRRVRIDISKLCIEEITREIEEDFGLTEVHLDVFMPIPEEGQKAPDSETPLILKIDYESKSEEGFARLFERRTDALDITQQTLGRVVRLYGYDIAAHKEPFAKSEYQKLPKGHILASPARVQQNRHSLFFNSLNG